MVEIWERESCFIINVNIVYWFIYCNVKMLQHTLCVTIIRYRRKIGGGSWDGGREGEKVKEGER